MCATAIFRLLCVHMWTRRWWEATWAMPCHAACEWCTCLRCAWRRHHALFWTSLEEMNLNSCNMAAFEDNDDQVYIMDEDWMNGPNVDGGFAPIGGNSPPRPEGVVDVPVQPPAQVARFRRPESKHALTFPWITGNFADDTIRVDWTYAECAIVVSTFLL